jgi:hypothetical protein
MSRNVEETKTRMWRSAVGLPEVLSVAANLGGTCGGEEESDVSVVF